MNNNTLTALVLAALDDSAIKALNERVDELAELGFKPQIVDELPAEGNNHTLYLVPQSEPGEDPWYYEYLWLDNEWEKIGTTSINFDDYYTKNEADTKFVDKESVDGDSHAYIENLDGILHIEGTNDAGTASVQLDDTFDVQSLDSSGEYLGHVNVLSGAVKLYATEDGGQTDNSITVSGNGIDLDSPNGVRVPYPNSVDDAASKLYVDDEISTLSNTLSGDIDNLEQALNDEVSAREQAIQDEADARAQAIQDEADARADDIADTKQYIDDIIENLDKDIIYNKQEISVSTNIPHDISLDGRFTVKRISNYAIEITDTLTGESFEKNDTNFADSGTVISTIRFDYNYINYNNQQILNVYYGGSRHDSDKELIACIRLLVTKNSSSLFVDDVNYKGYLFKNLTWISWVSKNSVIYPHPSYSGVVAFIPAFRSHDGIRRDIFYGINVLNKEIVEAFRAEVPTTASNGEYVGIYAYWLGDSLYVNDKELSLFYRFDVTITNNQMVSTERVNLTDDYAIGFKYLGLNYYTINNIIYDYSDEVVWELPYNGYILLYEKDGAEIALLFAANYIYVYNIKNQELLDTISTSYSNVKTYFHLGTGTYNVADINKTDINNSKMVLFNFISKTSYATTEYVDTAVATETEARINDVAALQQSIDVLSDTKADKDRFFDGKSEEWDEFTTEEKEDIWLGIVEDYVQLDISETYDINSVLGLDPQEEIISDMYEEEAIDLTNQIIGGNE